MSGEEVMLRGLYELASGETKHKISANVFGREWSSQSRAFSWFMDHIYANFSHLVKDNEEAIANRRRAEEREIRAEERQIQILESSTMQMAILAKFLEKNPWDCFWETWDISMIIIYVIS